MSIMPLNVGLFQGYVGTVEDQRRQERRRSRNEMIGAGADAVATLGVAFIEKMKREGREKEYQAAVEQGPEAVDELLKKRTLAGDKSASDLLDHFRRQQRDQAVSAKEGQSMAASNARVLDTERRTDIAERAADLSAEKFEEQQRQAKLKRVDTRDERRRKTKLEAEERERRTGREALVDEQRRLSIDATRERGAGAAAGRAARASQAADIERMIGPATKPEDRLRLTNVARRLRGGESVTDAEIAGAMGIVKPAASRAPTESQVGAMGMATQREAIDVANPYASQADKAQRALVQETQRANRFTANKIFKAAKEEGQFNPSLVETAAKVEQLIVTDTINRPKADGPWTASDLFRLADDLPDMSQYGRGVVAARAVALLNDRDRRVAAATPEMDAAEGNLEMLAAIIAKYDLTNEDVFGALHRPEARAYWDSVRILGPGDPHYAPEHVDYIQILQNGKPFFIFRLNARSMGYEGP